MNKNYQFLAMNLSLALALGLSASTSSAAGLRGVECDQPERQFTKETTQILAGMICSLDANNRLETKSLDKQNGAMFTHKWDLSEDAEFYSIDGVCAVQWAKASAQTAAVIVHPGDELHLRVPKFSAQCSPTLKATLEDLSTKSTLKEVGMAQKIKHGVRESLSQIVKGGVVPVHVEFEDNGYQAFADSSETQIFRNLKRMSIGNSLTSMLKRGLTPPSFYPLSDDGEGPQMGFGRPQMSQADFSYGKRASDTRGISSLQLGQIKAAFKMTRSILGGTGESFAAKISAVPGAADQFLIRQANIADVDLSDLDYNSQTGANAFFNSRNPNPGTTYGCSELIFNGTLFSPSKMRIENCQSFIRTHQF